VFDRDDFDDAIAELDARYLAGKAAPYRGTWSVIVRAYWSLIRHELPPTTPDWVNLDHRHGVAFASGDFTAFLQDMMQREQVISNCIETVHRLNGLGAVFTQVWNTTSQEGFDAEWRVVALMTVEGDLINRAELFDEADLNTAIAHFDEMRQPTPRLENAATRVWGRLRTFFDARDWDAMVEIYAVDHCHDDRRRITGSGIRRGRSASVENMRAVADFVEKIVVEVIAIRGERLLLARARFWGLDQQPQAFLADALCIVETNIDDRLVAFVAFDHDDVDAGFAELDSRYLAGEAAAYSETWLALMQVQNAYNKHEVPPTTEDCVAVDHRRGRAFAPGDLLPYLHATWNVVPDLRGGIEAVHRLTKLGAVITVVMTGSSQDGLAAEWREISLSAYDGGRICRFEVFDEVDLDGALARFDDLDRQASS
ncbi:MAG: hypothetical protein JO082_15320, partial [Mycobacterium sp.]|nr:hypothetical protein [Mycobacterium sp.]